jgi:hypothetical protein
MALLGPGGLRTAALGELKAGYLMTLKDLKRPVGSVRLARIVSQLYTIE